MEEKQHRLLEIIQEDISLHPSVKNIYYDMGKEYIEDFRDNLARTSIDLEDITNYPADVWKEFLSHPTIKVYLDGFRNEAIEQQANKALLEGNGTRDAINVKNAMKDTNKTDNSSIVVMLLPLEEG